MKNLVIGMGLGASLLFSGIESKASPEVRDAGKSYRVITRAAPEATSALRVRVFDATTSLALESATVLVGERGGVPFVDNIAVTDSGGQVEFNAPEITADSSISVTAHKLGYQALSVQALRGQEADIFLAPDPRLEAFHFLRGNFTGWPTGVGRSQVEIGLFVPAFRASTILNFDLGQIVSTFKEEIRVFGQSFNVPGNFVLPPQDKFYNFVPVHLEKPAFAMPLAENTQTHFSAIVGDAALSSVVTELRARDFLAAVNHVSFKKLNWTDWTSVTNEASFDVAVTRPLARESLTSLHGPVPGQLDLVAFAMLDPTGAGEALVPSDIKSRARDLGANRREIKLASLGEDPPGSKSYVFSALLDQAEFAQRPLRSLSLSAALAPVTLENGRKVARTDSYLGLVTLKSVSADRREFAFEPPSGAADAPEYLVHNLVVVSRDPVNQTETRRLLWTTILPPAARTLRLPELPGYNLPQIGADESLLWEVLAIRRALPRTDGVWDSLVTIENLKQLSQSIQALP